MRTQPNFEERFLLQSRPGQDDAYGAVLADRQPCGTDCLVICLAEACSNSHKKSKHMS